MENDNKKTIAIIVGIVALILIAGGFYYSYKKNQAPEDNFNPALESTRGADESIPTLDVKHQYKDGVHTYAGEINLPTPCDSIDVVASHDSTDANKVHLTFTSSNTSEVCAEVLSPRRFKTTIEGQKNVIVEGTLNGQELRVNVFEVPANEDLDLFEINIKG